MLSVNPGSSLNFDVENVETHGKEEEEEDAEEARRKEKELKDALATAFDDLIDDDEYDDYDDDQQHSHLSENLSHELKESQLMDHHIHHWPFLLTAATSTPHEKVPEGNLPNCDLQNNIDNVSRSREYYLPEGSSEDSECHLLNFSHKTLQHNPLLPVRTETEGGVCGNVQNVNSGDLVANNRNTIQLYPLNTEELHNTNSNETPTISNKTANENVSETYSRKDSRDEGNQLSFNNQMISGIQVTSCEDTTILENNQMQQILQHQYPPSPEKENNCQNGTIVGHDQYLQLEILYKARGRELEQCKLEMNQLREEAARDIRILKHQLILFQGDKEGLSYSLQQARQLIADKDSETTTIHGQMAALQIQLTAEQTAKEEVIKKLTVAESTIEALEKQLHELGRSENLARVREQHESIINSLKKHHQQELLDLKEEIDTIRHQLHSKSEEIENLQSLILQKEKTYHETILEKGEIINRLSETLEASQKQCQSLLDTGTIQEAHKFEILLHKAEVDKADIERCNNMLKEELANLQSELEAFEATHRFGLFYRRAENEAEDSIIQLGLRRKRESVGQQLAEDLLDSLKTELGRSLNLLRSRRTQVASLQEQLNLVEKEMVVLKERNKLYEQKAEVAEKKAADLQKKIDSDSTHDNNIDQGSVHSLQEKNKSLELKLEETKQHLKEMTLNQEKLNEIICQLKSDMSAMVKEHDSDKQMALEKCRESCLQLHQDAIETLRNTIATNSEVEKQKIVQEYEFKIADLSKGIEELNVSLDDVKALYIRVCEEKNNLDIRLTEIMTSENNHREAFEATIKKELEAKYKKALKELEEQSKKAFKQQIDKEVEEAREMWIKQKSLEVEGVLSQIKIQYEKQTEVLSKKEHDLEEKREVLNTGFEKLKQVKQELEKDKQNAIEVLKKQLKSEWEKERHIMESNHDIELNELKQVHAQKLQEIITMMQDTFKQQKSQNNPAGNTSQSLPDIRKLEEEITKQKISWQMEKQQLISDRNCLQQQVASIHENEQQLKEKLKKYQRHIQNSGKHHEKEILKLKEHYQFQIERLESKVTDLQAQYFTGVETRVIQMKKQHEDEMDSIKKQYEDQKKILDNQQVSTINCYTQTIEQIVPKYDVVLMQKLLLQSLKKIKNDVTSYLSDSSKRASERLQRALLTYHQQLVQRILQETIEDSPLSSAPTTSCSTQKPSHSSLRSNSDVSSASKHFKLPHKSSHSNSKNFQKNVASENVIKTLEPFSHFSSSIKQNTPTDVSLFNLVASFPTHCDTEDGQKGELEKSVVSETSTEFMHLPQYKTASSILTEAFRTFPSFWTGRPLNSKNECQNMNHSRSPSQYPEKLSSTTHQDCLH